MYAVQTDICSGAVEKQVTNFDSLSWHLQDVG